MISPLSTGIIKSTNLLENSLLQTILYQYPKEKNDFFNQLNSSDLRKQIENLLDERTDKITEILASVRSTIKHEISTQENRKLAFEKLLALSLDDIDSVTPEKITEIIGEFK